MSEITEDEEGNKVVGLSLDSLTFETRPRNVLPTKHPKYSLIPIYKVNYDMRTADPFIGSNQYHNNWGNEPYKNNNWNHNFMPGFDALYGYNLVNIAHFNHNIKEKKMFFNEPVLIKTLYYPAFTNDTLNGKAVSRQFYMLSVYDEDTDKDGFITAKDLSRFYLFDLEGNKQHALIPKNYTVMKSEYDSANDFMYIFAKKDENENGQLDTTEKTHIFWINLKNPNEVGLLYEP